jgi:hypothetical protein
MAGREFDQQVDLLRLRVGVENLHLHALSKLEVIEVVLPLDVATVDSNQRLSIHLSKRAPPDRMPQWQCRQLCGAAIGRVAMDRDPVCLDSHSC